MIDFGLGFVIGAVVMFIVMTVFLFHDWDPS